MDHEFFMKMAFEQANLAYNGGEVPVGAIVVFQNQIIASAHNQVESLQDATAHAELLAIRRAASYLGNWRLLDCTLYCTLEPCHMCAGAMILSRLKTAVWAAPDLRHGAGKSLTCHPIHKVSTMEGLFAAESAALLKKFFQESRAGII
jgi:tRNA(adenine34) deaminase